LPKLPGERDSDSEADNDPDWLQEKISLLLDEFTDVNEAEKQVMKMWNFHVLKNK